jgi:activating signal cointegrator 1
VKCLSLMQPWASLVILGHKRIETRTWKPRGVTVPEVIAIHASGKWTPGTRDLCRGFGFAEFLAQVEGYTNWADLPTGKVLGCVTLSGCKPVEELRDTITDKERRLGLYTDGRQGWLLDKPVPLAEPFPFRGALGLFQVPDESFPEDFWYQVHTEGPTPQRRDG